MGLPELKIEGMVATICLMRPDQANRLGPDDLAALLEHIETVNRNEAVRVLQLTSTGKYFCSGFDINKLGGDRTVDFATVVDELENARPVTVAVLQGGVYGGATDLALACDFRIGAAGVDMFMPAARLGLHYYRSGLERYVQRLGLNNAKRLFLTAEKIDARTMFSYGYLTHLADDGKLSAVQTSLVETLVSMAPIALLGMKKHLNRIAQGRLDPDDLQNDIDRSLNSDDLQEGRRAWAQKRPPVFKGS